MEADEVFSTLSDKLSDLQSKIEDNASRFDALRADLNDLKAAVVDMRSNAGGGADLKAALDQARADIQRLSDAVAGVKTGADQTAQKELTAEEQFKQNFDAAYARIDEANKKLDAANAAADKKYQEQQGLIGKLGSQAEEAGKMLLNFPDTMSAMAKKAVDDGKKEILGIWESGKADILNSISSITTPLVKDAVAALKTEIMDEVKALVLDQVKTAEADAKSAAPPPLTDEELEARITRIVKLVDANTPRS